MQRSCADTYTKKNMPSKKRPEGKCLAQEQLVQKVHASRRERLRVQSTRYNNLWHQTHLRSTPSEPIAKPLSPPKNLTSYRLAPMLVAPELNLNVWPPSVEYHRLPPPPTAQASLSFWKEGSSSEKGWRVTKQY